MKYNLKRVKVELDILMLVDDDRLGNMSLADIGYECEDGEWSLTMREVSSQILNGEKLCQKACDEHGTDLTFFHRPEDDS